MNVISLTNQKGGCGKSTIAINLALHLALKKKRVILFDTDPQKSSYDTLKLRKDNLVKVVAVYSNIYQMLEKYEPHYDFALIDTPPHDTENVTISIACSDIVLIPVQDSPLDIKSSRATIDLIGKVKALNQDIKAFFILSRIQPQTTLARELAEILKQRYNASILDTQISNRVAYKYSLIYGKCVSEMFENDPAATEIADLANEVLAILK
ncbi:putative Plasmid partition protein ParA-like protein [Desulfamplus magnetovallimortis]|uniref:Putative Plasmid partition protein ParA-like protein n=1 Tax=Desulfamplus magnetovallimortis TaxID=1246637 RepID=A0A1W1HGE6_9BACT|nr:ParA family partition ATPase [Desulfamplus magnetovallimortis]SLM31540.1 putative Plasmid partition protein ParA-like protein [Desulfamplus magnetovallimortis]